MGRFVLCGFLGIKMHYKTNIIIILKTWKKTIKKHLKKRNKMQSKEQEKNALEFWKKALPKY